MLTCIFENGNKSSMRHVTVDALVTRDNTILLIKRAPTLINPNKYALPGGFVDRDETVKQAVQRELLEETGYKSERVQLFCIIDLPGRKGEDRQNIDFVYLIQTGECIAAPDEEISEVRWIPFDKLPPEKEFAFDHYETIQRFLRFKKHPESLPILL